MANWCNNLVSFFCSSEQEKKLTSLFEQMAQKEQEEQQGQIPPFIKESERTRYLFNIEILEDNMFRFETKWSPAIDEIYLIAKELGIQEYEHEYEELGCLIFGKVICQDSKLFDFQLENNDFDKIQCDELGEKYNFEDEWYEYQDEILRILLDRKINHTMGNAIKFTDERTEHIIAKVYTNEDIYDIESLFALINTSDKFTSKINEISDSLGNLKKLKNFLNVSFWSDNVEFYTTDEYNENTIREKLDKEEWSFVEIIDKTKLKPFKDKLYLKKLRCYQKSFDFVCYRKYDDAEIWIDTISYENIQS